MNVSARRGSWFVTLPLAAGAIAYIVFVFLPGRQTSAEYQSQIRRKQQHLAHAGSLGAAIVAVEEELRLARQHRERWQKDAPSIAAVADLFAKIHRVETAAKVHTTRFDPHPVVHRDSISELPLSLGCRGTFADVFALVHGLECLPVDVWVRRLHIEKAAGDTATVQCRMDLAIFADNHDKLDCIKKSY